MEEVRKKYNSIDWVGLRRSAGKLKARAASNFKDMVMTDIENGVRAATSDTTWGATGSELEIIARATMNREEYPLVMGIVWERISSKKWRQVYKAMDLLKYLCLHGSQRCSDEARDALPHIQNLQNFRYVDSAGKDEGKNVRERAKQLTMLLSDMDLMQEEREKSRALRAKLADGSGKVAAVSSDDYRYRGGESSTMGTGEQFYNHNHDYGGDYQIDGNDYSDYNYGDAAADTQEASGVNTGLDDLLGLSDNSQPAALPPAPSHQVDDLFGFGDSNPTPAHASAQNTDLLGSLVTGGGSADPLGTFNSDILSALPAASTNTGEFSGFRSAAGSGSADAPAHSNDDIFAMAMASKPNATVGLDFFGVGGTAQSSVATSSDPFSVNTASTAAKPAVASPGLDVYGDLVNLDNMARTTRAEKSHDVHSGASLNAIHSGTAAAPPQFHSNDANDKNNHDLLFGL